MLEIRHLQRSFAGVRAVDDVSFDIGAGEFFSLVGPSGCGKTTLLRLIAGFDAPDGGDILLDGRSLLGAAPEQRPIHTVFQSYALFPHLTVAQNVAFPLQMAHHSAAAQSRRVAAVLEQVALADKADAFPHELSGGQRQRVALARAIADLPRILLLDEPLAALDAKLREQMQVELIRLQRELGITFIFVTHAQSEALSLSHRIGVMNQGRIVQLDQPAHLYGFPRNRFVAGFIGRCTLAGAQVVESREGQLLLEAEGLGPVRAPGAGEPGQRGWLALRPEQLQIGAAGTLDGCANRVPGRVADFLYGGDVTTYIVALVNGLHVEALRANTAPGRAHFFEIGDAVELGWPEQAGRFLNE